MKKGWKLGNFLGDTGKQGGWNLRLACNGDSLGCVGVLVSLLFFQQDVLQNRHAMILGTGKSSRSISSTTTSTSNRIVIILLQFIFGLL